jgi:short-subunit dehydrogenase
MNIMTTSTRPLAIVTGASSGIGLELARLCAQNGYDLVIAADEEQINAAAEDLRSLGSQVTPVKTDLSTIEGVEELWSAVQDRPVDVLCANAGRGLGRGFLDQQFDDALRVINTNISGTVYLAQLAGRRMRERGTGRILFTGSIAGYMPGTYQAVYNGTKAFVDSFSVALRHELKDTGVSVTCLMPGPTETEFFKRADMMDTDVGTDDSKAAPADVAKTGFDAMMKGESSVVHGLKNKVQAAMAGVTPEGVLAEMHRRMAEPGSASKHQ